LARFFDITKRLAFGEYKFISIDAQEQKLCHKKPQTGKGVQQKILVKLEILKKSYILYSCLFGKIIVFPF